MLRRFARVQCGQGGNEAFGTRFAIAAGNIPGESEDRIPDYDVFDDVDGSSRRVFCVCDLFVH